MDKDASGFLDRKEMVSPVQSHASIVDYTPPKSGPNHLGLHTQVALLLSLGTVKNTSHDPL